MNYKGIKRCIAVLVLCVLLTVSVAGAEIRKGETSTRVLEIQNRLIELGYMSSKADGIFGKYTENAVLRYAKEHSVEYKNGVITDELEQMILSPEVQPVTDPVEGSLYIANMNTGKFHHYSCEWVDKMYEENKLGYSSREAAIRDGYVPCKICTP